MADPSAPPEDDPELDEHDPRVDADPMMAARAAIVGLEAIADLFASFALQANRLAGVLEASITGPAGDTLVDWTATADDLRVAQAQREAAEIERRLAADDRTEVIRLAPTVDLRFPTP